MSATVAYRPRSPEQNPLYGVVAEHLETFLARQRERDRNSPEFVEREFRSFLDCGVFDRGLVRVHCDACGMDRVLAFSCKVRAVCNSCGSRRMADTAAHLVDRVFPPVPVRQWVLSLPYPLRYRLAYDSEMTSGVLNIFIKTVFASILRRAREFGAVRNAQCGAVTFIQRFDSALRLDLHFHCLAIDGVYAEDDDGRPQFQPLLPPENEEIQCVAESLAERIPKFFQRRGLGPESDPEESDPLARDEPWLARLYAASISGRAAFGAKAGRQITRMGDRIDAETIEALASPRCASVNGFSLHANVSVHAHDRERLERLARYCGRPPITMERLEVLKDGRVRYELKRPWHDGTPHIVMEPFELLEKLAALVPFPKTHLVRYSGLFAPAAKWRALVVPVLSSAESAASCVMCPAAESTDRNEERPEPAETATGHERNYSWAELMKRVWAIDVLACPRCQGRMRLLAVIHSPESIRKILECLGLPSRAPPSPPCR